MKKHESVMTALRMTTFGADTVRHLVIFALAMTVPAAVMFAGPVYAARTVPATGPVLEASGYPHAPGCPMQPVRGPVGGVVVAGGVLGAGGVVVAGGVVAGGVVVVGAVVGEPSGGQCTSTEPSGLYAPTHPTVPVRPAATGPGVELAGLV
jgi:hypothetical protein